MHTINNFIRSYATEIHAGIDIKIYVNASFHLMVYSSTVTWPLMFKMVNMLLVNYLGITMLNIFLTDV